eukprot:451093-Pleurochrysis_carterae.AAC.2
MRCEQSAQLAELRSQQSGSRPARAVRCVHGGGGDGGGGGEDNDGGGGGGRQGAEREGRWAWPHQPWDGVEQHFLEQHRRRLGRLAALGPQRQRARKVLDVSPLTRIGHALARLAAQIESGGQTMRWR